MAETVKVMIPEEQVEERIKQLGEQISKDYAGKQIHLILSLIHIQMCIRDRCLIEDEEMISDKCIYCGKPAKHMAYWGRCV